MLDISKAITAATLHHEGIKRRYSGPPYIEHPLAVLALVESWGVTDPVVRAASVLHDVCEDENVQGHTYPYSKLVQEFGMRIAMLVYFLTKPIQVSKGTASSKEEASDAMFVLLCEAPTDALIIKCADRICNLGDYPNGELPKRYIRESFRLMNLCKDRESWLIRIGMSTTVLTTALAALANAIDEAQTKVKDE